MEQEGVISVKDKELFSYAVYSLLFGLLPIFIVVILGLVFGMLQEGLLMITPFMLIRKFSGGYHLNSPKHCILLSSILIGIALLCVKSVQDVGKTNMLSLVVLISVIGLCACSPIDNGAKKLAEKERIVFGQIARLLSIIMFTIYLVLGITAPISYTASLGVGLTLSALLQVPCILKKTVVLLRGKQK